MKIFITGGSGFIGQRLNAELSKKHEILTQYLSNEGNCGKFNSVKADITNTKILEKIISEFKPDAIIHTAAVSKPGVAEKLGEERVRKINVDASATLARLAEKHSARIFFFSTDLVYDGETPPFKKETEPPNPLSLYARSKAEAEKKIAENTENHVILRIALHFGFSVAGAKSHFSEVYENLLQNKHVKLFDDQFRTPLEATQSAKMLARLLETDVKNEIVNFGGKERVSRYELGEILAEVCGFDKNLLEKISLDAVNAQNKVRDVSMNTEKLETFGIERISLEESIYEICKNAADKNFQGIEI